MFGVGGTFGRQCGQPHLDRRSRHGSSQRNEEGEGQSEGQVFTEFFHFHSTKNSSALRDSNQRARLCITVFTRRLSGLASGLIANAWFKSDSNSFTSCFWIVTA